MATPKDPSTSKVLAQRMGTPHAHELFQDLEIAFEWLRSLEEQCHRQQWVSDAQVRLAIRRLEQARIEWLALVMGEEGLSA